MKWVVLSFGGFNFFVKLGLNWEEENEGGWGFGEGIKRSYGGWWRDRRGSFIVVVLRI